PAGSDWPRVTVNRREPRSGGIRWTRVIFAGILLELVLVAVLVPIGAIFGAPPGLGLNQTGNHAVFLTAVPVACFVLGWLAGRIVVRRCRLMSSRTGC
ncbi:MAG TPA: hypothetical protein VFO31_02935, partial [Vicinamibacterales bacterium]|nr:hypothetical protein [Vicinamibacterales bacterium]